MLFAHLNNENDIYFIKGVKIYRNLCRFLYIVYNIHYQEHSLMLDQKKH